MFFVLYVSHLRPMDPNALGYQFHLLLHCHPVTVNACGHKGFFPSVSGARLTNFYRDASSELLQLVNQWLNFTCSRFHNFRYGIQNKRTDPDKIRTLNPRTCGYARLPLSIDQSGDEGSQMSETS